LPRTADAGIFELRLRFELPGSVGATVLRRRSKVVLNGKWLLQNHTDQASKPEKALLYIFRTESNVGERVVVFLLGQAIELPEPILKLFSVHTAVVSLPDYGKVS
jgi:hypothetical protein